MRRTFVLFALIAGLTAPASAAAATRYVSPTGSDGAACTSAAPCRGFARAYAVAAGGDTISLAAGVYGAQVVPAGTKAVTFRGVAGTKLRQLENSASNVTYDGVEVDAAFAQTAGFQNHGSDNVTFRDGVIGNVTDEKGALISGTNFTFDNVRFHDVRVTDPAIHNECIYAIVVPGFTIRNSTFRECATMDLFFTYGHWWTPLPPAYGDVTIENNVFAHSTNIGAGTWHYYSVYVGDTASSGGTLSNWVVRNNTFEIPVAINRTTSSGSRWVGNLGGWDCVAGVAYRFNVGQRCSGQDRSLSPNSSSASTTAGFGWRSPSTHDFRLNAGSPAVGAADPSDAPPRDRDGNLRDAAPDAGAYELGGTPGPDLTTAAPPDDGGVDAGGDGGGSAPPIDPPTPAAPVSESPVPAPEAGRLVGAWGFEETSGATARDTSGQHNDGKVFGAKRVAAGRFGRALSFDGANDYVRVPDAPSLDLRRGMTLEAWVRPATASAARQVIFKEHLAAGHQAYSLYAANGTGRPAAELAAGATYTTVFSTAAIAVDRWTHLAATYDGEWMRIYRNGTLVGSNALAGELVTSRDPLKFGGSAIWSEWFKGLIDEVRLFSGPRTASDIRSDMSAPISAVVAKRAAAPGRNTGHPKRRTIHH